MLVMERAQLKYFTMPAALIIYERASIPLRICASTQIVQVASYIPHSAVLSPDRRFHLTEWIGIWQR